MSNKREALERIKQYVARRKSARGLDDEYIHSFDLGSTKEARLKISDIETLISLAEPEQEPVAWGDEKWESLAWQLCADENGEAACTELIWEGGAIPEPWGDRWLKYEGEAKRLIALVKKHTSPREKHEQEPASREPKMRKATRDEKIVNPGVYEVPASRETMEWQPIETANFGEDVLVFRNGFITQDYRSKHPNSWTHWMPLPPPPKE